MDMGILMVEGMGMDMEVGMLMGVDMHMEATGTNNQVFQEWEVRKQRFRLVARPLSHLSKKLIWSLS